MATKEYIAAIELGSSKLSGIVGSKTYQGFQIEAYASTPSAEYINKGIIQNIDKTAQNLTNIINLLESQLGKGITIDKVYVGIGGQSLRTIKSTVAHNLSKDVPITQDDIEAMLAENNKVPSPDFELLEISPMEYKINGKLQKEPVGITGGSIEGNYLNIVSHNTLSKRINKSFEGADILIADSRIAPVAMSAQVLSNDEKEAGCVLVDLGADTTTVIIFKNGMLRHLCVIPLGSRNITKDICNEQISEEEAEKIKQTYGFDPHLADSAENETEYKVNEKRSIKATLLNDIIEARTEEIFANIKYQIEKSGYTTEQLISGFIFTGGSTKIKGFTEMAARRFAKSEIRIANQTTTFITNSAQVSFEQDASKTTLIGLLASGTENCCTEPLVEDADRKPSSLFDGDSSYATIDTPHHEPEQNRPQRTKPTRTSEIGRKIKDKIDLFGRNLFAPEENNDNN